MCIYIYYIIYIYIVNPPDNPPDIYNSFHIYLFGLHIMVQDFATPQEMI